MKETIAVLDENDIDFDIPTDDAARDELTNGVGWAYSLKELVPDKFYLRPGMYETHFGPFDTIEDARIFVKKVALADAWYWADGVVGVQG